MLFKWAAKNPESLSNDQGWPATGLNLSDRKLLPVRVSGLSKSLPWNFLLVNQLARTPAVKCEATSHLGLPF